MYARNKNEIESAVCNAVQQALMGTNTNVVVLNLTVQYVSGGGATIVNGDIKK